MTENEISYLIRGAAFKVHQSLGPGLYESVYEGALLHEITKLGLKVQTQLHLPAVYEGICLDPAFRIDMLVEDLVIVEIKSVDSLAPIHHKQVRTYLKLSQKKLGQLINFNCPSLSDKNQMCRIVNNL